MKEENSYYFNQLTKEDQKVYFRILNGLKELKTSFLIPRIDPKQLSDIYFLLRMDHPEIFYTVSYKYRYYEDSSNLEILPVYFFSKDRIKELKAALDSRIRKLARPAETMSEREKELYIHDFILKNVHYDKLKKEYSHEIVGPLVNGTAVCEGIAKSVKVLCDALNVWCIVTLSGANPEKGIRYRHCWNVVRLDGKYYHLDATFDNTLGKQEVLRYDYVNLSDAQIFRDHEPSVYRLPQCSDGDHFYYKEKKVSWTKPEDVENRAGQAVRKKKDLLFHWRGGYLNREILVKILEILQKEADRKEKKACVSLNFSQQVFYVRFEDSGEDMVMEQADAPEQAAAETEDV